jgi:tRNA pseudouridine32 synthase/23S rRNA pseudouridine746 synthase
LKIAWQDEFLVVVEKPAGVLSVASEEGIPCLAQTVFECIDNNFASYDGMVIHRLGTETSGLIVFAKTMEALRGMNTLFRLRQVIRQYEVLVCGHVKSDEGMIDMPLMRDYVFPPYMRVSTDEQQRALLALDASIVGKKLLEAPKPSQTHYSVKSHETLRDTELPVTRLTVTSITGRTHQLNVHCAAFGHPIVGDNVYGVNGEAAPYGGLELSVARDDAPDVDLQKSIAEAAKEMSMCVHATYLQFRHPVTAALVEFKSRPPF